MTEAESETDAHETRLKRLKIRCWRRGTKEMDLLFGQFADGPMRELDAEALDAFEALMAEADDELYLWISGASDAPAHHMPSIERVRTFHNIG